VSAFAGLSGGKQLDKSQIAEKGPVPVFGGAGLMGFTSQSNAKGYVITVGRVGAYCGQFFAHRGEAWVNNNASQIVSRKPELSEWLFWALKNVDIDVIRKGAAQPFVSNGDIAKLNLVSPGLLTLEKFVSFLKPIILRCEASVFESTSLAETRDYLLPKLMSGEVRVREVEKMAG
jgi:type I restriction enzyme, S subunit